MVGKMGAGSAGFRLPLGFQYQASGRGEEAGQVNLRYGAELGLLPITSANAF